MIETPRVAGESAERAEPARFAIHTGWFEKHNLSFDALVRSRICDLCRGRLGQEVEERVPVFDKDTGRPRFEVRRSTFGEEPMKVIKEHCGRAKNYITRDMPTLEAVFRILLSNGNEPMTLEQVRDELAEWCPGGGCQWLLLPVEALERLVRHDRHYGLYEAGAEATAGAAAG